MCGQPSHIHGTLIHWALIFKGQQEISPLDLTNKWLYVSFICVRMCLRAHTFASLSRQKCCCCRLPESGTLLIPTGPKRKRVHTHRRAHIPVDISHDWAQISLLLQARCFYMFWGVGGCQEIKHCFFFAFFFPRQNEKHGIYINWNTRNPA